MPVRVKDNTKMVFKNIKEGKVKSFIYAVASAGQTISLYYAPLEYGPLRASQKFTTGTSGSIVWGKVQFGGGDVDYATWLENNPNWQPRSPAQKAGPAWNPNAKPHFLSLGFEGAEAKSQQKQLMEKLKI